MHFLLLFWGEIPGCRCHASLPPLPVPCEGRRMGPRDKPVWLCYFLLPLFGVHLDTVSPLNPLSGEQCLALLSLVTEQHEVSGLLGSSRVGLSPPRVHMFRSLLPFVHEPELPVPTQNTDARKMVFPSPPDFWVCLAIWVKLCWQRGFFGGAGVGRSHVFSLQGDYPVR